MELTRIKLPFKLKKPILALGSQTKNRICFAKDDLAILTPEHPDLLNPEDLSAFEKDTKFFLKKNPRIIAYDLHPEYQSTKYAFELKAYNLQLMAVQHHHAHIASCMAENGLSNQKVIGVAFDGTGLGSDNRLWGAEFLVCDYKDFKRRGHLKEIPLLGGEKAILEPWRLAALWLYIIFKDKFLNLNINFVKTIDKKKWNILKNMYLADFNSPLVSSAGRLFDAAASLVLAKKKADFEAQLPMELEKIACGHHVTRSPRHQFKIVKKNQEYIIDPAPVFREIVEELEINTPKEKIAYRFHLTVAEMIRKVCSILEKETKLKKVVLSGGVFQNKLLLRLSLSLLYKNGFEVFTHKELSSADSGISLGEVAIANYS